MRGRLMGGVLLGLVMAIAASAIVIYIPKEYPKNYSDQFVMAPETPGYANFENTTQHPTVQTITLMRPKQATQKPNGFANNVAKAPTSFGSPSPPATAPAPRFANSNGHQQAVPNAQPASQSFGQQPTGQFATASRPFQPQRVQNGSNRSGLRQPQQPVRNQFGGAIRGQNGIGNTPPISINTNQGQGFPNTNARPSGFNSRNTSAAQKLPTIYEQVIKGMPESANNVKALVRAKYSISETDATKLSEVLAEADSLVETSMGEDELTMTCSQNIHMAVSRFISTFLTKDGSPSNLTGPERVDSVRFHNNIQRQVTQASYESVFEPTSLGFAPSAEDVKVLLRAEYELPADKAKLFESLLKTKSRLLLEANLSSPDELSSNKTATLTVTTTRAGQLAVAHLIDALFTVEEEAKKEDGEAIDGEVASEKAADSLDTN